MNVDCDLVIIPDTLTNVSLAFAVDPQQPQLAQNLSDWIDDHRNLLFEKWKRWWFKEVKKSGRVCDYSNTAHNNITIEKLWALFVMLAFSVATAFVFVLLRSRMYMMMETKEREEKKFFSYRL